MTILDLIGNTPIVEIPKHIHGTSNNLFAKLEYFNPTKSLKDRVAVALIADAEAKGLITKDTTIIEPTSGNMGISLAFVCALKGYRIMLTMSEAMSIERRKLISHFGAELVLTKKELGFQGAIDKAYELSREIPSSLVMNQYHNPANFNIHFKTTGPEIYKQMNGNIDIFIAGAGTGACISGASAYLKSKKSVHTIAIEPEENDILAGGTKFSPHALQGIGPNFMPDNFRKNMIDEIFHVSKENAYETSRMLAKSAGIAGGISSGGIAFAALEKAKTVENQNICFIVCDFCERYASGDLFL